VNRKSMQRLGSLSNVKQSLAKNRRASYVSEVMGSNSTVRLGSSDDDSGLEDEDEQVERVADSNMLDRIVAAAPAPSRFPVPIPPPSPSAAAARGKKGRGGDGNGSKEGHGQKEVVVVEEEEEEVEQTMPVLTLDDLIDIERVALEEMRQNYKQKGLAEAEIDGRTLCRVDCATFSQVWTNACRVSESVKQWAQVHVAHPEDIFEAFCSMFEGGANSGGGVHGKSGTAAPAAPAAPAASSAPPIRVPMVDFRELLCGLSVLCAGATREAKLRFIYQIYDTDRNQSLDADELHDMMHAVYSMFLSNSSDAPGAETGEDAVEKEVGGFVRLVFAKLLHSGGSSNDLAGKKDVDAGLSFAQFREVSVMQPLILQYLMSDDLGASVAVSSGGGPTTTTLAPIANTTANNKSNRSLFRRKDSVEVHERDLRARIQQMQPDKEGGGGGGGRGGGGGGGQSYPADTSLHSSLMMYTFVMSMERKLAKPGQVPAQMVRDWNTFMQGVSRALSDAEATETELTRERQAHDALDIELEEAEQRATALEEELRMEREKSQANEALLRDLIAKTTGGSGK
jgi:hypothetical protein